jgi:uncharacterized protein
MSSQPPDIARPLDEQELDELEDYLNRDSLPEDTMSLATLHGFLTAIVVGPSQPAPELWLDRIWGDVEPESPLFRSETEAQHVMQLLFRFMNTIALELAEDPAGFEPIHAAAEEDDEDIVLPEYWCEGFIRGTLVDREGWQPLFDSREDALLVLPILAHVVDQKQFEAEVTGPTEVFWTDEGLELIAQSAVALHAYWGEQRAG